MEPQEGPGDREEAQGQLGAQTWRKWATWVSRRESCLSFSVSSSTLEKKGHPRVREAYGNLIVQKQQSIVTETYCDDNSKRGPTSGTFGPGFCCFLSTKNYVEQV